MRSKKQNGKLPFWKSPGFRYGSFSTALLCAALALLISVNAVFAALEKKNGWRVDYSFNAMTTHSQATLEILEGLTRPVHIYALFARGQEDAPLEELLDRYAAASPLVTWEKADASLNPGLLTRFRGATDSETVTNDSVIVSCEETGRFRILSPGDFISLSLNYEQGIYEIAGLQYESRLTSAIAYVTQETIPCVRILQGHGELDESGTSVLASLLTDNHYQVDYVRLTEEPEALQSCDLLMILSPVHDLMDAELQAISAYIAGGGSVWMTCDYSDPVEAMPNWQSLMRSYGFIPMNGIVVASTEERDSYYNQIRIDLIPYMQSTDMTASLVSSGSDILLMTGCRAFETPAETDRSLNVYPILLSGNKAYLRDLADGELSLEQNSGDPTGPFALGLQAQRTTSAGYISKAVMLGCSAVLTSSQIHSMTDAQELIMTITHYLAGNEAANLNIMAKEAIRPQLSVKSYMTGSLILVCLPLTVLVAAMIILLPRKRL